MNQRTRTWRWSQVLALLVLVAAVLTMAAPFRGGGKMVKMQTASVMPLFATASLVHGASFQARSLTSRVACSGESLFRSAPMVKRVIRREILVRKVVSSAPMNFHVPRAEWTHLTKAVRTGLDRLAEGSEVRALEIRSTGTLRGNLDGLMRRARVLGATGEMAGVGRAIVLGNGRDAADGEVEVGRDGGAGKGPLVLYLVGDFNQESVSPCQWQALDEVLDYLEIKWGRVIVSVRPNSAGTSVSRMGLGVLFPTERFLKALAPPRKDAPAD